MLNARAYEIEDDDTEVIDVPVPVEKPLVQTEPIAIPRTPTGDLVVHVLVDGSYHRRHPSTSKTSCGVEFHTQFCPTRREELSHPLSRDCGCFTTFEIAEADELERSKYTGKLSGDPP